MNLLSVFELPLNIAEGVISLFCKSTPKITSHHFQNYRCDFFSFPADKEPITEDAEFEVVEPKRLEQGKPSTQK